MKKFIFIIFLIALFSSCSKDKCWVMSDCIGNDVGNFCGTEKQVQDQCQSMSTATCAYGYRRD